MCEAEVVEGEREEVEEDVSGSVRFIHSSNGKSCVDARVPIVLVVAFISFIFVSTSRPRSCSRASRSRLLRF